MNTTKQSLINSFKLIFIDGEGVEHEYEGSRLKSLLTLFDEPKEVDPKYRWSFVFGEQKEYELCLEPLIFDDQFYLALYKDKEPLIDKVCLKPGYVKEEEDGR